jgi:hypothetical protein
LRLQIVYLDLLGRIPDLELSELPGLLLPGAGQPKIARLVVTHNPYAVIHVPSSAPADIEAGAAIFREQCAGVIRPTAAAAPPLRHCSGESFSMARPSGRSIARFAMECPTPGWRRIRWASQAVATRGLHPLPRSAGRWCRGRREESSKLGQVRLSYDELAGLEQPGNDWLTYSGAYGSSRHSSLTQIDSHNVNTLTMRWIHQLVGGHDKIESSPIVRDGVMYFTVPPGARARGRCRDRTPDVGARSPLRISGRR